MLNYGSQYPAITVSLAVHMHLVMTPKTGFASLQKKRRVIKVSLSNK